jgi:hypothetical protein
MYSDKSGVNCTESAVSNEKKVRGHLALFPHYKYTKVHGRKRDTFFLHLVAEFGL